MMNWIDGLLICLLAISLVIIAVQLILYRKREKDTAELISYLLKVQDRLELPEMSRMREGQFGILQSEIYKLVALLREQYSGEKKQKRYLADMLSDISHQVKTPMAAITIMSDLLKTPELTKEQRLAYVEKIDGQVDRINWLIHNLLTLSQLEADMLELKSEEVLAEELLADVLNPLYVMAEAKGVALHVESDAGIALICDRQWTTEALSNIVKNCVEHTDADGSVFISVTQNNFSTNVTIRDTGEGIAKEHLPYIFKRFYKAPGAASGSVGIGLSMSKQLILRQNGTIDVKSEVGKGTEFLVKLYRR